MKKLFFISLIFSFLPLSLAAQEAEVDAALADDVEASMELGVEKKLSKRFNVALDGEIRSRSNASEFDRLSIAPSLEYKALKHLKFTLGGALVYDNNESKEKFRSDGSLKWVRDGYWQPRYRGFAAVTGDVNIGRFNISLRERYQITYRPEYTATRHYFTRSGQLNYDEDDIRKSKTSQVVRSRVLVSYDIRHCPVQPFASFEITNDLVDDFSVDKMRYAAGIDWKLNKHNAVEFCYMYQDVRADDGEDDRNSHIISLSYKYKF